MKTATGERYSSNGDRWHLAKDIDAGRVFNLHEPNAASGGTTSEIELGSFLNRSGHGPQHHELLRLIGSPQSYRKIRALVPELKARRAP